MGPRIVMISAFVVTLVLVVGIGAYLAISESGSTSVYRSQYMSQSTVIALSSPGPAISLANSSDKIFVNESSTIMVELSPSMGRMNGTPQEYFVIFGLVNPTIVAKQGISIRFVEVNMDNMEHNLVITTESPPYSYSAMMGYGGMYYGNATYHGTGMLYANGSNYARMMMYSSFLPPYSGNSHFPYENVTYTTNAAGNYWYICEYPGHAEEGMYGELIVD